MFHLLCLINLVHLFYLIGLIISCYIMIKQLSDDQNKCSFLVRGFFAPIRKLFVLLKK